MHDYNVLTHSGLGDNNSLSAPSESKPKWYESLVAIYGAYQGQRAADRLQKENLERMRQGMPPLSVEQYVSTQPPTAKIRHELDEKTKNMMIYGGIGLGAILLLTMMRKR